MTTPHNEQKSRERLPNADERSPLCPPGEREPTTYLELFRRALSKNLGGSRLREDRRNFHNEKRA